MSEQVILVANATVGRLMNASKEVMLAISDLLSYDVQGAEHMHAFTSGTWNGKSSFFTMSSGTFPAGFFHAVHEKLIKLGCRVAVKRKPLPAPLGPANPIVDSFGNEDPRYDYQLRALQQIERHGRGILQVATGGGKSKICKLIVARYRRMTMFLTTRGVLMYQMKEGFEECDFRVGVIGDGVWAPNRGVNVGMVQTLVSQLEETDTAKEVAKALARMKRAEEKALEDLKGSLVKAKVPLPKIHEKMRALIDEQEKARPEAKDLHEQCKAKAEAQMKTRARLIKLLEMVEVVIGEEAHEAGGNSYYEILRHCRNAQIRVALTATPFMRDDAESNMRLMAAFGPILIRVSEKELIDKGILATPYFSFCTSKPHPKLYRTTPWQRAYKLGYIENPHMHEDLVRDAVEAARRRMPTLTLIQRTAHGTIIRDLYRKAGLRVTFLKGENDQKERKRGLKQLAGGEIDVLIGTNILDVGVDVPAVAFVQLAGGHKAEVQLRQRIGRGLRAKRKGPNKTFIRDYTSDNNATLREHTATRRAIIEATPGFVERILADGQPLPWHFFDVQERKAA